MKHHLTLKPLAAKTLLVIMLSTWRCTASAQQFTVKRFTTLANDVSAFINPVRDLNGEACAVVKVMATTDFAFSSPLGIVKRKDGVGEIWLYLPKGSKQLTLKHPQWGVLRDYRFPTPLESRMTYELVVDTPKPALAVKHDTIVLTKTITDTIAIKNTRPRLPLTTRIMLTSAFHENGPSFGIMLAMMRRIGFFVHAQTDFRSIGSTEYACDKDGVIDEEGTLPYYNGNTRHANYALTAGLMHSLGSRLNLFYGAGYGKTATAWQLADSEGGGMALNDGLTHKGVAAEAGVVLSFGRVSVSASCLTIKGKQWQGVVGIGFNISKK